MSGALEKRWRKMEARIRRRDTECVRHGEIGRRSVVECYVMPVKLNGKIW